MAGQGERRDGLLLELTLLHVEAEKRELQVDLLEKRRWEVRVLLLSLS
jgi:hypothetical protein